MTIGERDYWRCHQCEATFLEPSQRPGPATEKAEYDQHDNDERDQGYRRFLARLSDELMPRLTWGDRVLDFGCGPGPALVAMLREAGFAADGYDPFYAPDEALLGHSYQAITCTEVVEHLHDPAATFRLLDRLLMPGGWLGVMTCFQTDDDRFAGWHYRRDPTHVVFYRETTLHRVAARFGWHCEVPRKDVALMRKPV
ncbi:methyltransferase type 12 [Halovibrio salipaludis]|uniref:Methyltransferase type 12 n=1 Tax=Halovibrio salipaludis TaxID=2032626 RepID=A0A2A2F5D7_9GAMM|nr:class I SAM-dependent methyltransferase [Halovibrio salipaludis]PAU80128.1 methyltransferase type 12 [Halovibrio salipaludis]